METWYIYNGGFLKYFLLTQKMISWMTVKQVIPVDCSFGKLSVFSLLVV